MKNLYSDGPNSVENILDYPACAIGKVRTSRGSGTGCLIGPNIVLTCGNNCYDIMKG